MHTSTDRLQKKTSWEWDKDEDNIKGTDQRLANLIALGKFKRSGKQDSLRASSHLEICHRLSKETKNLYIPDTVHEVF